MNYTASGVPIIDPLNQNQFSYSFRFDPNVLEFLRGMQQSYADTALRLAQSPTAKLNLQSQIARMQDDQATADRLEAARQYNAAQKLKQQEFNLQNQATQQALYRQGFQSPDNQTFADRLDALQKLMKLMGYGREMSRSAAINPQFQPEWSWISGYNNVPR